MTSNDSKLREKKPTISHQDQGALGFGPAVVDLDSVSALIGSGESIHRHLDDTCGHIVADLVSLRGKQRKDLQQDHIQI